MVNKQVTPPMPTIRIGQQVLWAAEKSGYRLQ